VHPCETPKAAPGRDNPPSPWQSGGIDHEQGIFEAGNACVCKTMGQPGLAVAVQPAGQRAQQLVWRARPGR